MRKLLLIFAIITLITFWLSSIIACSETLSGNPVFIFVYNGNQKFSNAPIANGKSINGIDDATKSGKNENGIPYEYALHDDKNGEEKNGLFNNIINPILYGINLTKDNSVTTGMGVKWTNEQIESGLEGQKNKLIKSAKTDVKCFFNNKKINQKLLWEEFYKNYSTSYDSHYTQVALLANENKSILNKTNYNLVSMTGNAKKINNKNWVKEHVWPNNKKSFYVSSSLKVLSPIASIIKWLNDPNNNYNQIDQNSGQQSARYIIISIPNVTICFEFQGEHGRFTFTVTIDKLVAYINYLVYENPNSIKDYTTYGHQWFFINYGFYDFDSLKDDDYHNYNFNDIPDDIKIDKNIRIALGFVKKNDKKGILMENDHKDVEKRGQFLIPETDYTFPALKWKINVDSININ